MRYLGAWRKGETGLEAEEWRDGKAVDAFNICRPEHIQSLISFLNENWPKQLTKALTMLEIYSVIIPAEEHQRVRVKWADAVFKVPSRTGGKGHIVTVKDDRWSCVCTGYDFRGTCWAIDQCKENHAARA